MDFFGFSNQCLKENSIIDADFKTDAPVIGVLTVPLSKKRQSHIANHLKSYLANSYVQWLEMGGARVVPICYHWPFSKINEILSQINGVLFPGGAVDRVFNTDFYDYVKVYHHIFNYAKRQQHFPLWGTCLGFEFLMLVSKYTPDEIYDIQIVGKDKDHELRNDVKATNDIVPIKLIKETYINDTRFFSNFNDCYISEITSPSVFMNHDYAIDYNKIDKASYEKNIHILSTNKDREGNEYISTIEFKDHPFFGTQWHPEKVIFEWLDKSIPHDPFSQYVSRTVCQMFVNECKKNSNKFRDQKLLIYYYTLYSREEVMKIIEKKYNNQKNKSLFEQCYYFEE